MKSSHNMYYCRIVPCGFDSKKTQRFRRKYVSETSEAWVTLFEYHNLWWYVFDVPGVVDARSVGYVGKLDMKYDLRREMDALGFKPLSSWEALCHD